MRPLHHVAASAACAGAVYGVTRSPLLTAANFLAGVFIDIDHIPDYLVKTGFKKTLFAMLKTDLHLVSRKTVVFLHGFDLVTIIAIALYAAGMAGLGLALWIGFVQHLLLDTWYNPVKTRFAYFLSYRICHGFETDAILHRIDTASWRKKRGF